jgi:pyruvate,orthophosphate dikinase
LCELHRMGLPVPPAFIITTDAYKQIMCSDELKRKAGDSTWKMDPSHIFPASFTNEVQKAMKVLEGETGRVFGGVDNEKAEGFLSTIAATLSGSPRQWKTPQFPLLVSVRSGAAASMGGMMDSVLNVGMNDKALLALIESTDNPMFAYDVYKRFLESFGNVVYGIDRSLYNSIAHRICASKGGYHTCDLVCMKEIVDEFRNLTGDVPEDPVDQLSMALFAVFNSWNNPRAVEYRELYGIDHKLGTAVTVQSMVYGNMNLSSGSGLCFTRNPCTGEKKLYGEYFPCCEGDVIADGSREPAFLEQMNPKCLEALQKIQTMLEEKFRDAQAVEFTVENSELYLLQAKAAPRSAMAAVQIAVDLVDEGLVSEREALLRINSNQLKNSRFSVVDPEYGQCFVPS